jgi:hypothetical protein
MDTPSTSTKPTDKNIISVPIKDALFQLAHAVPSSENRTLRIRWDTTVSEVIEEAAKLLRHVNHPIVLLENFRNSASANPNNRKYIEPVDPAPPRPVIIRTSSVSEEVQENPPHISQTPAGKERIRRQYEKYKDIMHLDPYMSAPIALPDNIYKILLFPPVWPLPIGSLHKTTGCVRLCTATQVLGVLRGSMRDVEEIWVLKVRYEDVAKDVKWDNGFSQLEGVLERNMVRGTAMMRRAADFWSEEDWERAEWVAA